MRTENIKVWDLFIRCFHWSLAGLFVIAYLTAEEIEWLHVWSGYGILMLVGLRLVWGLIGSHHARFINFIKPPKAAFTYIGGLLRGTAPRCLGHNAAGSWMVILLLTSLTLTGASGLLHYGEMGKGPVAADTAQSNTSETLARSDEHSDHDEGVWYELHELFANLSLTLVLVHIAGVMTSSLAHRENLARAMITGKKRAPKND